MQDMHLCILIRRYSRGVGKYVRLCVCATFSFYFLGECVNVFVCLGPYVFVLVLQCVRAFGALLH